MHAGKVVRLRQKLADVTGAVTGLFGRKADKDPAVARLDSLKVSCLQSMLSLLTYLLLSVYSPWGQQGTNRLSMSEMSL